MNWRDVAAKLRRAPKALLSSVGVPDDASDSEIVSAVFRRLPELKAAANIDDTGLDKDFDLWQDLRAKRAVSRALATDAAEQDVATRKGVQVLSELGSYPLNESLRRAGKIGPDETLGDVSSDVVGGGAGGAAASAATSVLTDPLTFVGAGAVSRLKAAAEASPVARAVTKLVGEKVASKIPTAIGAAGVGLPYVKVMEIGQEKGFNSPEFKAALAGTTAAVATAVAATNPEAIAEAFRRPKASIEAPHPAPAPAAPVAPRPLPPNASVESARLFNPTPEQIKALQDAESFTTLRGFAPDPFAGQIEAADKANRLKAFGIVEEKPALDPSIVPEQAPFPVGTRSPDFNPPEADMNEALIQDLQDVDSLTPPKKKTAYVAESGLDDDTRALIDADEEHLRGILGDLSVNAKSRPKTIADAIPPFYKWDLIKEGAEANTSLWPKEIQALALEGGPNAPLRTYKPNHGEVRRGNAFAGQEIPMEVNSKAVPLDLILERLRGKDPDLADSEVGGFLHENSTFTELIDAMMANREHPTAFVGADLNDTQRHALDTIYAIGQDTGLTNGQIRAAILTENETPNKIKVREALRRLDPMGSHEFASAQRDFDAAAGSAQIGDADIPLGAEEFNPEDWIGDRSAKKIGGKKGGQRPFSRNPEINSALDRIVARTGMTRDQIVEMGFAGRGGAKPERLEGITETQVRGLENELRKDPNARPFDEPPAAPHEPPAAPPNVSRETSAPTDRLPEYDRNEWSVERARPSEVGLVGGVMDDLRAQLRTHKSALIAKNMPNLAEVIDRVGQAVPHQGTKASVSMAQLDLLKPTNADLEAVAAFRETGKVPDGADPSRVQKISKILSDELDRTHQLAIEKDPIGTAKWEPNYYPRTGVAVDAIPPRPLAPGEKFQPLDVVAKHRAASLGKERVIDPASEDAEMFTKPITDKETLYGVLKARARTAGAVMGAATKERTPENYPLLFDALVKDEERRFHPTKENPITEAQSEKARAAAGDRLLGLQLPDIFEATAKDRPGSTWSDIVNNKEAVDAVNAVVLGRDAMNPGTRKRVEMVKEVAAFAQLGQAAAINLAGLSQAPSMAYSAVRDAGGSAPKAAGAAFNAMVRALGLTAKATAEDISFAIKRAAGGTDLSPSQVEFGTSGTRNPVRKAVMVLDRNARKGIADALEPYMQYMRPETLKFIDRGLEGGLANPRNIEIMRQELSARSQGAGTAADRLKPTGNDFADAARELSVQYSGPSLRQIETAVPRLNTPGKAAAALGGAAVAGELVNDLRGVSYGTGVNAPGANETEDQKKGGIVADARGLLSKDRSPDAAMRLAQDVAVTLPGFREVAALPAYGNIPMVGPGAAVGGAANAADAIKTAFDTKDWRALLAIVNMPGAGREWLKIAQYEAARRKAAAKGTLTPDTGLGHVPQNIGLPFKIEQMLAGKITPAEALRDTVGVGGPSLQLEKASNRHRREAEARKKK